MVLFNFLLGFLDLFGDHRVLDDFAFLKTHAVHERCDTFGAEHTHQVIFEGDVELGATRVALTTGTAAQLTVHTT